MTEWTKDEQREHRKLWVEALRSGKYKQTRLQLKNPKTGAMCCLGVACEISGLGVFDSDGRFVIHENRCVTYMPLPVREWLGLRGSWGEYDASELVVDNDSGKRFSTIAKIIESEPEGLIE